MKIGTIIPLFYYSCSKMSEIMVNWYCVQCVFHDIVYFTFSIFSSIKHLQTNRVRPWLIFYLTAEPSNRNSRLIQVFGLIIHHEKILESDWLKAVQFFLNRVQKSQTKCKNT